MSAPTLAPVRRANKVVVKFSLANDKRIPSWIPFDEAETETEGVQRRTRNSAMAPSHRLFAPASEVSLVRLLDDLDEAGYSLVSVKRKVCKHQNGKAAHKSTYHTVKLIFSDDTDVRGEKTPLETFKSLCAVNAERGVNVVGDLQSLLDEAFWNVVAYYNPHEDGVQGMVSLNLNVPTDRYSNGVLIQRHVKDEQGNKTGERRYVQPKFELLFTPQRDVLLVEPLCEYGEDA